MRRYLPVRAMLLAALGEPLNASELAIYRDVTKREEPPTDPVAEFWFLVSRRAGKTLSIACLAAYLSACCDYRKILAPGERGTVLILAASMAQGHPALNILKDIFTNIPAFAALVDRITADTISLTTKVDICIRPASWRTVRGLTCVCAIAEECGVWLPEDGGSKNPDKQILNAVRPALATTRGSLYVLATPLYKRGEVWRAFSKHFGANGSPNILVANAPTRAFNPLLDQSIIDQAYEEDPESARCEWGGEFRDDAAAFVSMDAVLAVVERGVTVGPYEHGRQYTAFVDPATGAGEDSFTCAIGHAGQGHERGLAIIDAIYERRPPFSPAATIGELCNLLREYHVTSVTGDRFAKGFVSELFSANGIRYVESEQSTSDNYLEFLTIINSKRCQLLDNKRLISQLAMLERRPSKTGARDLVTHPTGAHDDIATSCAGLVTLIATKRRMPAISDALLARAGMPLPQVGYGRAPLMASWARDGRHQQTYQSPPGGSWSDMYDRMKGH